MPGGSHPPYRMPCGGARRYYSAIFNQRKNFEDGLTKFVNDTLVRNRDDTSDVSPYERNADTSDALDSCESEGSPVDHTPWPRPYAANTWHADGTVNLASCYKRGWKAVQAGRNFHGRIGYLNADQGASSDNVVGCGSSTALSWLSAQTSPTSLRYCQLEFTVEYKGTSYSYPGPVATVDDNTVDATLTIDPQTGKWVASGVSATPNAIVSNKALSHLDIPDWDLANFVDRCSPITATPTGGTLTWTGGSVTVTGLIGGTQRTIEQLDYDIGAGTLSRTTYHWEDTGTYPRPPGVPVWTQFVDSTESISLGDDSLSYYLLDNSWESHTGGSQLAGKTELTVTATLGDENLSSSVVSDAKTIAAAWNLTDDGKYPWRTDPYLQAAPLVTRDEHARLDFSGVVTSFFVADYGHPVGSPALPPDGTWDGDAEMFTQLDPAFGGSYQPFLLDFPEGFPVDGLPVGDAGVTSPTSWTIVGGSLPPGVTMDGSTGILAGTPTSGGRYAITVLVSGTAIYDGSILGSPKSAGYENFFDFGFIDYKGCCNVDDGFDPYIYGWGQDVDTFNSQNGTQIPRTATQWSNRLSIIDKPPGAWMVYLNRTTVAHPSCPPITGDIVATPQRDLTICKYAEAIDLWKSQNFGRPGGVDKFIFDETAVYAVGADYDGTNFTPKVWSGGVIVDATISSTSGVWGGSAVGGFYDITFSSGQVHLGTKRFDVPTGWVSASGDSDVAFGRLRFPTSPSILGRAAVTYSGTTATFADAQPSFGMEPVSHHEQVDVYDANMVSLASNVTATRVDDTHFTTGVGYPTAAWVQSHGAPAWYFDDDHHKGDFVTLQWIHDQRSKGEYDRLTGTIDCSSTQVARPTTNQGGGPVDCLFQFFSQSGACLPFVPCAPKVACFSPNGESFQNGLTIDLPGMELDDRYGSIWQGFVVPAVQDLIWQTPHKPYSQGSGMFDTGSVSVTWDEDDVSCKESSTVGSVIHLFYAHAPMVEARVDLPANYGPLQNETAPALPSGSTIGFVSPVTDADGQKPPPCMGYNDDLTPVGTDTAWQLHQRFCDAPGNATCSAYDYSNAVFLCR